MVTVECNILYCFESSSFAILFFIIKNFDCFGLSANFVWGIKRRVRKDGGEKTEEVVGC